MPPWRAAERERERERERQREELGSKRERKRVVNGEGGKRREERREEKATMCSPARVPFRQFFKIKSLSVLVKCISRPPKPTPGRVYQHQHQHQQPLMPLVARSRALLCHSLPHPSALPLAVPHTPRSIHVLRLMTDSWPRKKVCKSAGTRQTEIHGSKCAAIVHTRSEGASGLTETAGGWIVEKEG